MFEHIFIYHDFSNTLELSRTPYRSDLFVCMYVCVCVCVCVCVVLSTGIEGWAMSTPI